MFPRGKSMYKVDGFSNQRAPKATVIILKWKEYVLVGFVIFSDSLCQVCPVIFSRDILYKDLCL